MNKQEFRKKCLKHLESLSSEAKEKASKKACQHLMSRTSTLNIIASYSPLIKQEVDLSFFNQHLALQKMLCLPKVEGEEVVFYIISDLKNELKKSCLGILEPDPRLCKKIPVSSLELILVPGVAFDQNKNRLGRGRGYYDRFIQKNPNAKTLSVAFKEQAFSSLPFQELHDEKVNEVIFF